MIYGLLATVSASANEVEEQSMQLGKLFSSVEA